MVATDGIGLGDLITRTANEIRKARDAAPKDDPVLTLSGCELELSVTVSAEGSAGIKVWLLDLSAKGDLERSSKITLKFGPAGNKPDVFLVDGKSLTLVESTKEVGTTRPALRGE